MTEKSSPEAAHAKSPHPVRALLRSLRQRVSRPRFLAPFAVACALVLFAEDRLESLFESDEHSFVAQAFFRLTRIYQSLVTWERFPYPRYTAIVAIDRYKEPRELNDRMLPLERKAIAELICRVHTASPAVIAVDKYFGPNFDGPETDDLRRAIESVTRDTVVIVGRQVDENVVSTKTGDRNFLVPSVNFGIRSDRFQEAIVNIDLDTRKIPLRWEVYESREEAEKSTGAPAWHNTFPLQAALAHPGKLLQRNRRISSLIGDNKNPFTSFLKADDFEPILAGRILAGWIPASENPAVAARTANTCSSGPLPKVLSQQMAGRVVLIGEIDHEVDDHSTVVGQMSGLLVQANYIEALLDDRVFRPVRILDYVFGVLILAGLEVSLIVFRTIWMEEVVSKPSSTLAKSIILKAVGILKAALSALALLGLSVLLIGFVLFLIVQLLGWYVDPTPLGIIPVATEILAISYVVAEAALSARLAGQAQGTSSS